MSLHEWETIDAAGTQRMAVPGGWLYCPFSDDGPKASEGASFTFVPDPTADHVRATNESVEPASGWMMFAELSPSVGQLIVVRLGGEYIAGTYQHRACDSWPHVVAPGGSSDDQGFSELAKWRPV